MVWCNTFVVVAVVVAVVAAAVVGEDEDGTWVMVQVHDLAAFETSSLTIYPLMPLCFCQLIGSFVRERLRGPVEVVVPAIGIGGI